MQNKLFTNFDPETIFTILYSWKAPERYWFPKTRAWYVSYSFFFLIIIGILALLGEIILIITIIAFVFLWFVQGAIQPQVVEHVITTLGIKTFDKLYRWRNIKHFWFSEKDNIRFLNLELVDEENPRFVKRFSLLTNTGDDKTIFDILIQYADYGEKDEIGFNFLVQLLHGKHLTITTYLPDDQQMEKRESEPAENN